MRSYLISENRDSYMGMKLVGIEGVYCSDPELIEKIFKVMIKEKDIGIIFLTEKAYYMIEELVMDTKKRLMYPLITVIPDRFGYQKHKGIINKYIKESVGL